MKDKKRKKITEQIKAVYKRLADAIADPDAMLEIELEDGTVLTDIAEKSLIMNYNFLLNEEKNLTSTYERLLKEYPIYTEFLKGVRGVGPVISAIIISEIDIHKATYPSSLWRYAGLDVGPDGLGRSKRKEHLITVEYTAKDGSTKTKLSITYNPFLKTKLMGVLAPSFLKSKSSYSEFYYNYKNRLQNHPVHKEKTKGHIDAMSNRYMIKRFLVDLYTKWRTLEGLPVSQEYSIAKLGMIHREGSQF